MNRKEIFIWLVYAGLGMQITTSTKAIDCMTIALLVTDDLLPGEFGPDIEAIATMAKGLIGWRFNNKARPRWIRKFLPDGHPLLEGVK